MLDYKTKEELLVQAQRGEEQKDLSAEAREQLTLSRRFRASQTDDGPSTNLTCCEKVREFYAAPITKFWLWSIFYVGFLAIYTWFVLLKTPDQFDNWREWFIVGYAGVYGCELIREFFMTAPKNVMHKVRVFAQRRWNLTMTLAVLMLLCAAALRLGNVPVYHIRLVYVCNIVIWYGRVLNLMATHSLLGPYTIMFGKTLFGFLYLSTIVMVILSSYGLARHSILRPNTTSWDWDYLRDVVYEPYFNMFGEVFPDSVDVCGDKMNYENCVPGHWVPPILQAIYMLVMNTLLLNVLIATVANIFTEVQAVSQTIWKYYRHDQIMEYEQKPLLPPPLSIFKHVYLLLKFIICRICCKNRRAFDQALKLILDEEQTRLLLDFEAEAMDELSNLNEMESLMSPPDCIARADDKSEFVSMKIDDVVTKNSIGRETMHVLELRLQRQRLEKHMRTALRLPASDSTASGSRF